MIQRAIAIMEALAGGPVDPALMLRVARAFVPDGIDPDGLTNVELATYFVRGVRRLVKNRVLGSEEQAAMEIALQEARAAVEAEVGLGND